MNVVLKIAGEQEERQKKRKARDFVAAVCSEGEMGNKYFHAAKRWLLKREYLRDEEGARRAKYLMLTDKGRDGLFKLCLFLVPPQGGLGITLDLGGKVEVRVRVEPPEGDLNPADEFRKLSTPRSQARIIGLATLLGMLFPSGNAQTLKIKVDTEEIRPDFSIFLSALWARYKEIVTYFALIPLSKEDHSALWARYREIVTGMRPNPLTDDFKPPTQSELDRYGEYWRQKEERERRSVKEGGEIDFKRILPWGLHQAVMEHEAFRGYIDRRLDEDPDWFMPHFFWVQLGFKQRKRLDEASGANPPSFITISNPEYLMAGKLGMRIDRIARFAKESEETPISLLRKTVKGGRKGEMELRELIEEVAATVLLNTFKENQDNPLLYGSWLYLREHYREKIPEVSEVLDAALARYIWNDQQPSVDLQSAFRDLTNSGISAREIARMIREGSYKLIENQE